MHELYSDLEEICGVLADELSKANEKLEKAGREISAGDLDYIDKLTHALKSVKTTKAMVEAEDEGYSWEDGSSYARELRGGNRGGQSRMSYARGRGRNARRDSMGRYSRRGGYSMDNDDMIMELRELMEDAPDEATKMEFKKFISKMEQM